MRVLALLTLQLQLPLAAASDNGLALVPPRGWRSWNQVPHLLALLLLRPPRCSGLGWG